MAVIDQLAQPDPTRRRRRRTAAGRPPWMDRPSPTVQSLKVVAIAAIVVVMLYPFLYVIMFSFADGVVTSGQLAHLVPPRPTSRSSPGEW